MIPKKKILSPLIIIHIFIITLSNFFVSIPLEFLKIKITLAAFIFPLVIVLTDLTVRLLGKDLAQKTIAFSFPFAIISSIIILYIEKNPISVSLRIGFASGIAYVIGILLDINVFQFIRERYSAWGIAPTLSTILSNIIDSYTFFFSAFYNSENIYMSENWIEIAFNQTLLKIFIGIMFFLPIYGFLLNLFLRIRINKNKN